MTRPPSPRTGFAYAPFYCEENVWHLAADPRVTGAPRQVVLVSNPARSCPLWNQRAGNPVVWDYHVWLQAGPPGGSRVFDLDTTLGLPVPLRDYLDATFPLGEGLDEDLRPLFRVVAADEFRARFASDRSHMAASGRPAPPWPPIRSGEETMTLPRFLDLERPYVGEVLDLAGLRARFGA